MALNVKWKSTQRFLRCNCWCASHGWLARTSGAATDAVTALQRVFSEYRLVTDTKLAQLDAQAAEAVADLKHFIELELNQLEQDQQTALNVRNIASCMCASVTNGVHDFRLPLRSCARRITSPQILL